MHIVNEILDYNRIVSGKISITPTVFQMENLLQEVFTVLKYHAEKKGIKLYSDFDIEDISYVKGDAFRLKQILYNLLGNGIKYTDKGHVALNVSCKKNKNDLHFMFVVEDTGIGMTYEDTQHIFNEFERVDQVDKSGSDKEGAGLGLSITKLLVEQQGGRISVRSKPGEGSTFTVYLKYETADEVEANIEDEFLTVPIYSKGKVWLIDDDAFILDLCSTILNNHGITHKCFSRPTDLLNEPWDNTVTMILTDIRMPEMSGIELCERLREQVPLDVKIVALTAQVLPEEKEMLLKSGFDGIIHKPFREEDLIKIFGVSPEQLPVEDIDFSAIEKMTFGDTKQFNKLLHRFLQDTKSDLDMFKANLDKEKVDELSALAHRLAGRISQFGGKNLGSKLREMELTLNSSQVWNIDIKAQLEILAQEVELFLQMAETKIS